MPGRSIMRSRLASGRRCASKSRERRSRLSPSTAPGPTRAWRPTRTRWPEQRAVDAAPPPTDAALPDARESRTAAPAATRDVRGEHRVRADVRAGVDAAAGADVERALAARAAASTRRARVRPSRRSRGSAVERAPGSGRAGCRGAPAGTSRACRCRSSSRGGRGPARGRRGASRAGKKPRSIEWFTPGGHQRERRRARARRCRR